MRTVCHTRQPNTVRPAGLGPRSSRDAHTEPPSCTLVVGRLDDPTSNRDTPITATARYPVRRARARSSHNNTEVVRPDSECSVLTSQPDLTRVSPHSNGRVRFGARIA